MPSPTSITTTADIVGSGRIRYRTFYPTEARSDFWSTPSFCMFDRIQSFASLLRAIDDGEVRKILYLLEEGVFNHQRVYPTISCEMLIILNLFSGVDVNQRSVQEPQDTPLHLAARLGRLDIVCLLLSFGANPDKLGGTLGYTTPLFEAAQAGHLNVVKYLAQVLLFLFDLNYFSVCFAGVHV